MTSNAILSCTKLGKSYEDAESIVPVLTDVQFSVAQGEQIAIVGRSGSGKTTLLNLLGGLEVPTHGEVKLNNISLSTLSEKKRGHLRNHSLGFIFQFHHLFAEFSALENVCMPLLIQGVSPKIAKARAHKLLEDVQLSHRYTHKPSQLSGGERQRVAIARALVTTPKCILADEPTGNLDNENAELIYQLMLNLTQAHGTSFVVVTHDMALAQRMHKTYILEKGVLTNQSQTSL